MLLLMPFQRQGLCRVPGKLDDSVVERHRMALKAARNRHSTLGPSRPGTSCQAGRWIGGSARSMAVWLRETERAEAGSLRIALPAPSRYEIFAVCKTDGPSISETLSLRCGWDSASPWPAFGSSSGIGITGSHSIWDWLLSWWQPTSAPSYSWGCWRPIGANLKQDKASTERAPIPNSKTNTDSAAGLDRLQPLARPTRKA